MSNINWWFLYQQKGGEESWALEQADKRSEIVSNIQPAFVSVLDLSGIPVDHDWSKVKYRGPLYFDFDADGQLDLACSQFRKFLDRLEDDLGFDLNQARLFASGSKGFHVEIPQECFIPKISASGTTWLAAIYKAMAETLVVDTMDFNVYSGKRGRMWRTPGVKRENGNYKVPITLAEATEITPELYAELIAAHRPQHAITPPSCNAKFAMLFDGCREKVVTHMRGAKKRREKADKFLDPWKASKKTPPTIEAMFNGDNIAEGASFQHVSMQLAIYGTAVGMELEAFLTKAQGLCEKHVSDSSRYNTVAKRRERLADIYRYMETDSMYDFDVAPIIKLVKRGTKIDDLGVLTDTDTDDGEASVDENGEPVAEDKYRGVRKGFVMTTNGMFRQGAETTETLCRAWMREVVAFYDLEHQEFKGYGFDLVAPGKTKRDVLLSAETFTSAPLIKKFLVNHQLSFQGNDADVMGLLDVMAHKAEKGGKIFIYPREGLFIIDHPYMESPTPEIVYLTQDLFYSRYEKDTEGYFELKYRPAQAISSYNIDIHKAPSLGEDHRAALHDLFNFSREDVMADIIGWFVACHLRSFYLRIYKQFPLLQVYGEAGAGKSQTVWMMAHLHWFMNDISMKSAASCTPFAMDIHASTSTSAPFIIDEFKPRELKAMKGRYEKFKDVIKASYIGADIGERGTINKGAENNLAIIKSRATAPIVFIGEAVEMETAIVERSVTVALSKTYQTKVRAAAFNRLHADGTCLSAVGKTIVEWALHLDPAALAADFDRIKVDIESRLPDFGDTEKKRPAPRMVFNRAIIVHGLTILGQILHKSFGEEFDGYIDALITGKKIEPTSEESKITATLGMSEASKVLSRMAMCSRDQDAPWELRHRRDYLIQDGWIEIKVERAYDNYRRFCASISDQPLFDSMDTFLFSMASYNAAIDRVCAGSLLREDGSNERIIRFDLKQLNREGVKSFRI